MALSDMATIPFRPHLLLVTIYSPALLFLGTASVNDIGKSMLFQKGLGQSSSRSSATMSNNGRILGHIGWQFRHGLLHSIPHQVLGLDAIRLGRQTRHGQTRLITGFGRKVRRARIHDQQAVAGLVDKGLEFFRSGNAFFAGLIVVVRRR